MSAERIQTAIECFLADDEQILLADGFEDAFIGIGHRFESTGHAMFATYDREKCIQIMIDRDGMDPDEAEEFFQFNVEGAYMGETTPAFVNIPAPA